MARVALGFQPDDTEPDESIGKEQHAISGTTACVAQMQRSEIRVDMSTLRQTRLPPFGLHPDYACSCSASISTVTSSKESHSSS